MSLFPAPPLSCGHLEEKLLRIPPKGENQFLPPSGREAVSSPEG